MHKDLKTGLLHLVFYICMLMCFVVPTNAQNQPPNEAIKVAKEFLESLKPSIKSGNYPDIFRADENAG